jgi:hypothetical protein
LESLSLKWLQALQKKYGVVGPRKKGEARKDYFDRIAQPLIAAMGAERLIEELRADVLAGTLSGMMASYRWFNQIADMEGDNGNFSKRVKMAAILTDNCPFCLEASKRLKSATNITLHMLPPFHPGCRCCPGVFERAP